MEKRKLNNTLEVLSEVPVTFPDIKAFMDEKLEEKCARDNIIFFVALPYW